MLKRIARWPKKRPRKPGAPDPSVPARPTSDVTSTTPGLGSPRVSAQATSRLDTVTLVAKALLAACDVPVVGVFVKPFAGLAVLGCETAQTIISNKDIEEDLAWHAQRVQDAIERSVAMSGDLPSADLQARVHLEDVLTKIHHYLESKKELSSKKRTALRRFVSAARDRDLMIEMKAQLNEARDAFNVAVASVKLDAMLDALTLRLDQLPSGMDESHSSPKDRVALQQLPSEVIALVHRMDGPARSRMTIAIFCFRADATEVLKATDKSAAEVDRCCSGTWRGNNFASSTSQEQKDHRKHPGGPTASNVSHLRLCSRLDRVGGAAAGTI